MNSATENDFDFLPRCALAIVAARMAISRSVRRSPMGSTRSYWIHSESSREEIRARPQATEGQPSASASRK